VARALNLRVHASLALNGLCVEAALSGRWLELVWANDIHLEREVQKVLLVPSDNRPVTVVVGSSSNQLIKHGVHRQLLLGDERNRIDSAFRWDGFDSQSCGHILDQGTCFSSRHPDLGRDAHHTKRFSHAGDSSSSNL
jgi:hypothetical protein